jgi:hypothetical protein
VGDDPEIPPDYDPCPRRTRSGQLCERPRHHVGSCGVTDELRDHYRAYIKRLRSMAVTLTRDELAMAVEYHLLAWRVLRNEYNGR